MSGQFRSLSKRARVGWQRPLPSRGIRPSRRGSVPPSAHSGHTLGAGFPCAPRDGACLAETAPPVHCQGRESRACAVLCSTDPGTRRRPCAGGGRFHRRQESTRGCHCAGSLGATAGTRLSRPTSSVTGAAGWTPALSGHALRWPAHHETVAPCPTEHRQGN